MVEARLCIKSKICEVDVYVFADDLAKMYAQQDRIEFDIQDEHNDSEVDSIEVAELKPALSKLAISKSCDEYNLVGELLQSANDEILRLSSNNKII